jgi:SAM-dependent methyltransferase
VSLDPALVERYAGLLGAPAAPPQWHAAVSGAGPMLQLADDLLSLGPWKRPPAVALDAGCGDGSPLLGLVLLGVGRGIGIDIDARRIGHGRQGVASLPAELGERLDLRVGDVAALPAADASVDLLLSLEGVGVYLDLDAFLREAARVVRPGGAVVISELNNARNPRLRESTEDLWEVYEQGPVPLELHDHRVESTYVGRRAEIVRALLPEADDAAVDRLARATTGLLEDEIRAACDAYAHDGRVPPGEYRRGVMPISPDGMVVERPVDPVDLAARLDGLGFRATARGYWGGAGGAAPVRIANAVLAAGGRATLSRAPSFRVVGVRR